MGILTGISIANDKVEFTIGDRQIVRFIRQNFVFTLAATRLSIAAAGQKKRFVYALTVLIRAVVFSYRRSLGLKAKSGDLVRLKTENIKGDEMVGQQKAIEQTGTLSVERLAQQLGIAANAKYIYGEPVERDGVTVIPVAKAAYGFGGGSGKREGEEGSGGGGGVVLTPVGYIEIKNGETRFRRIIDLPILIPLITAGSLALLTVFWGVGKLIKISQGRAEA